MSKASHQPVSYRWCRTSPLLWTATAGGLASAAQGSWPCHRHKRVPAAVEDYTGVASNWLTLFAFSMKLGLEEEVTGLMALFLYLQKEPSNCLRTMPPSALSHRL
jgi:hypothetical protein